MGLSPTLSLVNIAVSQQPKFEITASPAYLFTVAVISILVLLVMIIRFRIHAFYTLVIVSLITALVCGVPLAYVVETLVGGFSKTIGGVALLVGFGAVLGRIIEVTGGAKVLADAMLRKFGEKRAPFALSVASLFYGFPIFLDAGFVVMLPIIYQIARRLGGSFLLYVLPSTGAFLMMHALAPPHPGPVAAAMVLGANVGFVLLVSLIIGIPVWYFAGYKLAVWLAKKVPHMEVPSILGEYHEEEGKKLPSFGLVLTLLLMPLVLIFINTGFSTLGKAGIIPDKGFLYDFGLLIGNTPIALLITSVVAMITLVVWPNRKNLGGKLEEVVDDSLAPVCGIILITGAGGMFAAVLTATGIGPAFADVLSHSGLPIIVAGFLVAVILRIAQGSATVAATAAAGLMQASVEAASLPTIHHALVVVAICAGAISCSHVNDSGFWLVSKFCGIDTKTMLKTWSVISTAVGFMSFALAVVAYYAIPMTM
ncbi:GntP family permease [Actinotignum urinale]|uniref:GntP family permease n=1 Tax=Actinotignum urinale TaxID=190146 RepID=A0ABU5G7A4_9ACTO|nr:GntP family permease [Actinotignum urinale]MDY5132794.1 GntP family permease [Actinotignum urinale]